MNSNKIRKKFIKFFEDKGHKKVQSSSLWPKDDPSVLLTTAGMQQIKPYIMGTKDPVKDFGGKRLVSIQKCFRTSDIEEVGDASHNTFFEMLGNFSIGDYFKKEAIDYAWHFLTRVMKINEQNLWATYFKGDKSVKRDSETKKLWLKHLPANRIKGFGKNENWWGPPGKTGPCGPSSEIHYDFSGQACLKGSRCLPNCGCGRFVEIWNLVFMEFRINDKGKLSTLPIKNIDTGMGLERLALIVQKKKNIYETDLFDKLLGKILEDKNFVKLNDTEDIIRSRIIADHLKGSIFLISDGINFSNKEQGYILRRIFRRALDQFIQSNLNLSIFVQEVIEIYKNEYGYLENRKRDILNLMNGEFQAYKKILNLDVEEIVNKITNLKHQTKNLIKQGPTTRRLTPDQAFQLYTTYGLSPERIKRKGYDFDEKEFNKKITKHQELSRQGAKKKFGGHGLDSQELSDDDKKIMTRYHTATHLLHQALREVLGSHVKQQGSDINPERLRFDFEHQKKLSTGQKKEIEDLINSKIREKLEVTKQEMTYNEAIDLGALAFFKEKYPEKVTVYSIGNFSKEICGGPHVENLSELGNFSIISEKSSSAGIRRIKAKLSNK